MSILAGETLADEKHLRELREADLWIRTQKTTSILVLGAGLSESHTIDVKSGLTFYGQGSMDSKRLARSLAIGPREGFSLELGWEAGTFALSNHWAARTIQQLRERSPILQWLTSADLIALKNASENKNHQEFARLARAIKWVHYPPAELRQAIDLALALDMVQLARELAQEGRKLFPRDERIQRAVDVLSPPSFVRTQPSERMDFESSQQWLKEHASQHRGLWVAVRAGILLGSAPTLKELYQQIGLERRTPNTVVVKVLS
jgi:hypothetical protein